MHFMLQIILSAGFSLLQFGTKKSELTWWDLSNDWWKSELSIVVWLRLCFLEAAGQGLIMGELLNIVHFKKVIHYIPIYK